MHDPEHQASPTEAQRALAAPVLSRRTLRWQAAFSNCHLEI